MVNFSKIGMRHHNKFRRKYNEALFLDIEINSNLYLIYLQKDGIASGSP